MHHITYTAWLKKMDSISYIYISWTIHGMWMVYITFERGGPKFLFTNRMELHPNGTGMFDVFWMNLYLNDG